jgi:NADH-quinone oxidoreductase subunit L
LYILATGAMIAGYLGQDLFLSKEFWGNAIASGAFPGEHIDEGYFSYAVTFLPLLCAVLGISMAYLFYYNNQEIPQRLAIRWKGLYQFSLNKGFVDELYDWLFVRRMFTIGKIFWKKGDRQLIDAYGPDGVTTVSLEVAKLSGRLQTGYVYHYAFAMLVGIVALTTWLLISKGL